MKKQTKNLNLLKSRSAPEQAQNTSKTLIKCLRHTELRGWHVDARHARGKGGISTSPASFYFDTQGSFG